MPSREGVPEHTSAEINQRIEDQTKERIDYYANNPARIDPRLRELDEEWDLPRLLAGLDRAIAECPADYPELSPALL